MARRFAEAAAAATRNSCRTAPLGLSEVSSIQCSHLQGPDGGSCCTIRVTCNMYIRSLLKKATQWRQTSCFPKCCITGSTRKAEASRKQRSLTTLRPFQQDSASTLMNEQGGWRGADGRKSQHLSGSDSQPLVNPFRACHKDCYKLHNKLSWSCSKATPTRLLHAADPPLAAGGSLGELVALLTWVLTARDSSALVPQSASRLCFTQTCPCFHLHHSFLSVTYPHRKQHTEIQGRPLRKHQHSSFWRYL